MVARLLRVPLVRWFPALILLFFIVSAAIAPNSVRDRTLAAGPSVVPGESTDTASAAAALATGLAAPPSGAVPMIAATPVPATAPPATITLSPMPPTDMPPTPAPATSAAPPMAPVAVPAATDTPAPAPATVTATPTTAPALPAFVVPTVQPIPTGPTATPDRGAPGIAAPVGGTIPVPVLMYHYIRINPLASDSVGFGLSVTPLNFAAQMDWIVANGYHSVLPSELRAALTEGASLPTKPIVITFDDGYRDFYNEAWPVLKRLGLKSSIAVITAYADKGDAGDQSYMNWGMIRELDRTGMVEVASHTVFHADLSRASAAQRWTELSRSKDAIEEKLAHPCQSLVYPSGMYNDAVVADARRAGYQIAFTTRSGKVRVAQDGGAMLVLPRVRVSGGETLATFAGDVGR